MSNDHTGANCTYCGLHILHPGNHPECPRCGTEQEREFLRAKRKGRIMSEHSPIGRPPSGGRRMDARLDVRVRSEDLQLYREMAITEGVDLGAKVRDLLEQWARPHRPRKEDRAKW